MVGNKTWDIFACHTKKEEHTPIWLRDCKNCLAAKGIRMFLDVDDLVEITREQLELEIACSTLILVFLDKKIFFSPWCANELASAQKHGVPIYSIYNQDDFRLAELIDFWRNARIPVSKSVFGDGSKQVVHYSHSIQVLHDDALDKLSTYVIKERKDSGTISSPCVKISRQLVMSKGDHNRQVFTIGGFDYAKQDGVEPKLCIYGDVFPVHLLEPLPTSSAHSLRHRAADGQFVIKHAKGALKNARRVNPDYLKILKRKPPPIVAEDVDREITILQRLRSFQHDNVITLHAFGRDENSGDCYLLFKQVGILPEPELHQLVRRRNGLPESEACTIFRKITLGVEHLHVHGVAHGDLSLDNVLISDLGEPVIIDFGCARLMPTNEVGLRKPLQAPGSGAGKPMYMAPEAFADHLDYDGISADSWSLGVILVSMITANMFFETPSVGDASFDYINANINHDTGRVDSGAMKSLILQQGGSKHAELSDAIADLLASILIPNCPRLRFLPPAIAAHPWCYECLHAKRSTIQSTAQERRLVDAPGIFVPPHRKDFGMSLVPLQCNGDSCHMLIFNRGCHYCGLPFCKSCYKHHMTVHHVEPAVLSQCNHPTGSRRWGRARRVRARPLPAIPVSF